MVIRFRLRWDKFDTEQTMTYGSKNAGCSAINSNLATTVINLKVIRLFNYQAGLVLNLLKMVQSMQVMQPLQILWVSMVVMVQKVLQQLFSNLKPEEVRTIEIGTKWDVYNDRLNLTAAIFRTEKQNTRATTDDYNL
jgi:catecholate siderophore receptor